ncbi:MAG: transposase, partial [Oscillospiraceae bacterium]|nr:transposase [Oscillospiraceae bacterium]
EKFPQMHDIVMDCGYKTPWICKQVLNDERIPVLPYKRPMGKKGFFPPYEYVYDAYYDCVLCPENHVLSYATTDRKGYRQFKGNPCHCKNCPSRSKCTESKKYQKVVTKHIWSDYLELAENIRHTTGMKELYALRKETIERVFADMPCVILCIEVFLRTRNG